MFVDRFIDGFVVQVLLVSGYRNNDIQPSKQPLMLAKAFSNQSFQSIAGYGAFDSLAGNGQTQAWISQSITTGN